jgi:translation initiation factor IF-2
MQTKRPPIVVVMGSVDHGKTTLLDYIRKTNIAAKEAGAITQSIGAYEITHQSRTYADQNAEQRRQKITFIDTPGHEAFSKMRQRGARIADIAIIVVAADDSVKPQTKEAIKIVQETQTPFIAAINKIDKSSADVTRTKNDLMQAGVLLEGYGGNISGQEISAKTGQGVNELLDLILLTAEMEELTCDPDAPARGIILEAKLDSRRGIMASAIVTNGTIKTGDYIKAGSAFGKIKILENFLGKKIETAVPSSPVLIWGFETLPDIGEEFKTGPDVKPGAVAEKAAISKPAVKSPAEQKPEKAIRIILKADVSGSLEALREVLRHLPLKDKKLEIIEGSVGNISDGDVKLAVSSGAAIIGFRVKTAKPAEILARAQNIKIIRSDIIYDLTKALEEQLTAAPPLAGKLKILAVFGKKAGKQQIIGGQVAEGEIKTNSILEIERENKPIGKGRLINLQQNKKDVQRVSAGLECGLLFESETEIRVGDILTAH